MIVQVILGTNICENAGRVKKRLLNPVSRITGEGRAVFSRAWDSGLDQEGAGGRGGGGAYIYMDKLIDKFQYKEAA